MVVVVLQSEFFKNSIPVMERGATFTLEHAGEKHENIDVGLSDDHASLVFVTAAGKMWSVMGEPLSVKLVHLTDKDGLVISTKKTGDITFTCKDK
jgi:hypothetical protein